MSDEKKDEYHSDPWAGKRTGETHEEAKQRQKEELEEKQATMRLEQQADAAAKLKGEQEHQDSIIRAGGGSATRSLPVSGKSRSLIARVVLWLGWASLILGLVFDGSLAGLWGISLKYLILGFGAVCLGLVYLHQLVNLVILLFVSWLFYANGQTDEGFQFGAVPFRIWASGIALVLVMFTLSILFERRR